MYDLHIVISTIPSTVKESIMVYKNTARYSGADLFGGLLDRYRPPSVGNTTSSEAMNEQFSDGLTYLHIASNINGSDANSIILFYPMKVCFCDQGSLNYI